jgi:hypothetical protein
MRPASTPIRIQAAVWAGGALVCLRLGAVGRETLARTAPVELSSCRWADSESLDVR